MDNLDSTNPEQRALDKFYTRIRMHLDDIEPPLNGRKKQVSDKLKNFKEDEKYGKIEASELKNILGNYDHNSDKPVKSDRVTGGSFAKLLYSRPGFHHPSSTDYLVECLNIKEHERDTFLGGHSTYTTPEDISLKGILKHHTSMLIKNRAGELLDRMDNEQMPHPSVMGDDVYGLVELNPSDGNALAVRGKYHLLRKRPRDAVKDLKKALESNCDHVARVKLDLAEACFRVGMDYFSGRSYDQANLSFLESLSYDPHHEGSKLHHQLSLAKVQEMSRRFGEQPNTFLARRR